MTVLRRFLLLLAFGAGFATRADYLFPYEVELQGVRYSALVLVPDYYGTLHFGVWDDTWRLVEEQKRSPIPYEVIRRVKDTAEEWLWRWYVEHGILPANFRELERFKTFRLAESLHDQRSAVVLITKLDDLTDIRAMLRTSSRLLGHPNDPHNVLMWLPYEIRGMLSPRFRRWRARQPRPEVAFDAYDEPMFFMRDRSERTLEMYLNPTHWISGAELEIKSLAHRPEIATVENPGRKSSRVLQDFLPLLMRLAKIHKLFVWTGVHAGLLAGGVLPEARDSFELALTVPSKLLGRPATASDLGIRANRYRVECGPETKAMYEALGFVESLKYGDLHLRAPGSSRRKRTFVMTAERERFDPRLDAALRERRGSPVLPASRAFYLQPLLHAMGDECALRLFDSQRFVDTYHLVAAALGFRGVSGRAMPWP